MRNVVANVAEGTSATPRFGKILKIAFDDRRLSRGGGDVVRAAHAQVGALRLATEYLRKLESRRTPSFDPGPKCIGLPLSAGVRSRPRGPPRSRPIRHHQTAPGGAADLACAGSSRRPRESHPAGSRTWSDSRGGDGRG